MTKIDWENTPQEKENLFKDANTPKYTDAEVLKLLLKYGWALIDEQNKRIPPFSTVDWWNQNKKP